MRFFDQAKFQRRQQASTTAAVGHRRTRTLQRRVQNVSPRSTGYHFAKPGCIIVCSSNDRATLEETIKWKRIIQENADYGSETNVPCLLVQNKSDLIDNASPEAHQTKKFLEEFARTNDFCGYMQCSAKENKNVDEIFQTLLGNQDTTQTKPSNEGSSKAAAWVQRKRHKAASHKKTRTSS
jgi:GTPase SAR1 family protein